MQICVCVYLFSVFRNDLCYQKTLKKKRQYWTGWLKFSVFIIFFKMTFGFFVNTNAGQVRVKLKANAFTEQTLKASSPKTYLGTFSANGL